MRVKTTVLKENQTGEVNQNGLLVASNWDPVSQDMMTLRRLPSLIHQLPVINLGLTLVIRNIVDSFKHAQNL